MVRGQTLRVHLTGGAPWGFRLQGGSDSNLPITISKIRRRSKANLAKLEEGDEIVAINGKSCEGITRDGAMTYIDNANETLDVEILRRETNNNLSGIQSSTPVKAPAMAPVTVTHAEGSTPGTLQFKFQAPQFNPMSIPVGPPPKTGVWSPGSQQQSERRQTTTTTYHDTPDRRQSTTTTTITTSHSTPQEKTPMQATHSTTRVIQPMGTWQPNKASTPRHEEIEITLTPGIRHEIKLPESPITPISMVTSPQTQQMPEEDKSNPSILDDPSLILAGMGPGREESNIESKKKSKSKIHGQRPFSYAGYSNVEDEDDVFASVDDQKRICKKISDLLMFPTNKQAKGAKMFMKRRKKSAKWTKEGMGTRHVDEYESMPELYQPTTPVTPFNPLTPQPPPPPPPMPPMPNNIDEDDPSRLLFQFHIPNINTRKTTPVTPKAPRTITIEPTNFNINLRDPQKCAHTAVSPNLCSMLAQDLKSAGGRASQMFAKRQKRVEKFVTDESNVKVPQVIATEVDNAPGGAIKVTLKGISSEMPSEKRPVVAKHKTPWEAAMESPYGAVDGAFDHIDTGPMKVQVNIPKNMVKKNAPASTTMATGMAQPPVSWTASSVSPMKENVKISPVPQIRPKFKASTPVSESEQGNTFKPFEANYNRKPRGWSPVGGTNRSASPATSDVSATSDTRSLPSSFTDFNPKPRAWASPSNESAASYGFQPVSSSMMESEDL
ncbi:uncharacterized protein LOC100374712 isoform X2 [Saccoglossus kowalevskii]